MCRKVPVVLAGLKLEGAIVRFVPDGRIFPCKRMHAYFVRMKRKMHAFVVYIRMFRYL